MRAKLYYTNDASYCEECYKELEKSITPITEWEEIDNETIDLLTKYGKRDGIICIVENYLNKPEPYLPSVAKFIEKYKKQQELEDQNKINAMLKEEKRRIALEKNKENRIRKRMENLQKELDSCRK